MILEIYLLGAFFAFGAITFILGLLEIRTIRNYILSNQNVERVPKLSKEDTEKKANATIRIFRKDIFSAERKNMQFSQIRKQFRVFRFFTWGSTSIMCTSLFLLYWSTRK